MKHKSELIFKDEKYFSMLALMASLSNLFSESEIPFIHYRITENLFCKYLDAINLSRTDTAYDAKKGNIGIGIKTFTLPGAKSREKIAEFNTLSVELKNLKDKDLAFKLAQFRNERMRIANELFGITSSIYHIIGRRKESLYVFNTPYEFIDTDHLKLLKSSDKSLHFTDGKNQYSFSRSKSVLMKEFELPDDAFKINVNIIEDPFSLLESLLSEQISETAYSKANQVLLPLFSEKNGEKFIPEKSGLNQWNAGGRKRDKNEVYIPIPAKIYKNKPDFFPERNTIFTLILPDGSEMSAKVCQDSGKALMSNPNKDLGDWILRKILNIKPYKLATYKDLEIAGFDSVVITKSNNRKYYLNVCRDSSFEY